MKKKILLGLGLALFCVLGLGSSVVKEIKAPYRTVLKEDSASEPEVFESQVIIEETAHGKVSVSKQEGHAGEIVELDIKSDVFYVIGSVKVNGTVLIDEDGVYSFALVEGENKVTVKFVIDEATLGELSTIVDQAANKDWTNLFSVKNIISIIAVLLNSGILLAVAKVSLGTKANAKATEKNVSTSVQKIIPETIKKINFSVIEEKIVPALKEILVGINVKLEEGTNALITFARCLALSQENTPEAKLAITKELSSLKISDKETIAKIENEITEFMNRQTEHYQEIVEKIKSLEEYNKEIVMKNESEQKELAAEGKVEEAPEVQDKKYTPYE